MPAGGPGRLELGVHGPGGDRPLRIAGVGPPADAPLVDLLQTQLQDIVGDVVAGRPFPLAVSLGPRGWWNFEALHLPDRLVVSAAHPGGTELSSTELLPDGPVGAPYTGHLTIPETGDIELTFLLPGANGQPDTVITASPTPIQVIESGVRLDGTTPAARRERPDGARGTGRCRGWAATHRRWSGSGSSGSWCSRACCSSAEPSAAGCAGTS